MESLPLFILASIALIITPGPDIIYVLTRSNRAGLLSAFGVTLGVLFHTIAAPLGLALLLKTSVYAPWPLKIIGGTYLMYLGIQVIKNTTPNHSMYMILLGLIYALMTILFLAVLGLFAGSIGTWLKSRKQIASKIRVGSGSILMLLGFRLLVSQKH